MKSSFLQELKFTALLAVTLLPLALALSLWSEPAPGAPGGQPVTIVNPTFQVSPSVTVTAQAYSAGQSEGGLITVTNMARRDGPGTGILQNLTVVDDAAQTGAITALLFRGKPSAASTIADTSTVTIAKADEPLLLGTVSLTCTVPASIGSSKPSICVGTGIALSFQLNQSTCAVGQGLCYNGFLVLMATAGRTQASTSDLSVTLAGPQD